MGQDQIPTYHLAPNFSIGPAPNGPIELGSILQSLQSAEVINTDCHLSIPPSWIYCHHKTGFTATRHKMRKGEYGIWAQFVSTWGIGGELSWAHETTEDDTYSFAREDTIYFSPTPAYIKSSMAAPDVADWIHGTNFDPVYMVTGLKIAHSPSVDMKRSKKRGLVAQLGLQKPGGLPLNVGPKLSVKDERGLGNTWEKSDDFIIGIRVKKLVYKRIWFSRNRRGELEALEHNRGAQLLGAGGDDNGNDDDDVLEVAVDEELMGMTEIPESVNGGLEISSSWIVPNLDFDST